MPLINLKSTNVVFNNYVTKGISIQLQPAPLVPRATAGHLPVLSVPEVGL